MKPKKIMLILLSALLLFSLSLPVFADGGETAAPGVGSAIPVANFSGELDCKSAVLMDAATGTVLFEKNADEALPPASVTKVMTLLLVMEALDAGQYALTDMVTVSAHAASMGGSQVFLKEGETMSVEEMVKCVVISSANDCAVALAEFTAGSEESFVERMNTRAAELGLANTHFENTNGLDDTVTNHKTSARDIALMSAALIRHPTVLKYSGIWMDTILGGTFGLTNTNRLIRFYKGSTGLKTGSTSKAKFCISATAERDGMELIAVIMAAPSRDVRNNAAKTLLDWGYANFSVYKPEVKLPENIAVSGGCEEICRISADDFSAVIPKNSDSKVQIKIDIPEKLSAPVEKGSRIGSIIFTLDGETIGEAPVKATDSVKKMGYTDAFRKILAYFLGK